MFRRKNTSRGKSLGCGEVKRILISGSICDTLSSRVRKVYPPFFGLYLVRNPGAIPGSVKHVEGNDISDRSR